MNVTHFRAWTLPAIGAPLRLEERPIPQLHCAGVLVRVESAMVLSYMDKVLDGSIGYVTLDGLAKALGPRVRPAIVSGADLQADVDGIQAAAEGHVDTALDLLGQATSTATTLATLRSLKRGGRLVLMGSARAPLEISFGDMLSNNWEVVGNFMYPSTAPASLAGLVSSGMLDLSPIRLRRFAFSQLPQAITAAKTMRDLDLTTVEPLLDAEPA